jgi:hypothetical protein
MQSVGETSLPSRSVTAMVMSKTYRRTRDNRALSTQGCAFSPLQAGNPVPELRSQQGQHPSAKFRPEPAVRTSNQASQISRIPVVNAGSTTSGPRIQQSTAVAAMNTMGTVEAHPHSQVRIH